MTTTYDEVLIGGQWAKPSGGQRIEVRSPATLDVVGSVPEALEADVDAAVDAARQAVDHGALPPTPPAERAAVLKRFAELLTGRIDEVSGIITSEMGAPSATVQMMMWTPAQAVLGVYDGLAETFPWEETRHGLFGESRVRREPVGVVAAIIPWNVPLFIAINKLIPALLAGCTVILKPAPETPIDALWLGALFTEAGLPDGVLSVLPADREGSEYLVTHPGVDKVSFTGSTAPRGPSQGDVNRLSGVRATRRVARHRAAQAGVARARRQVGRDRARRRRPRGERLHARLLRAHEHRPGLRRADSDPGSAVALRRGHRGVGRGSEDVHR